MGLIEFKREITNHSLKLHVIVVMQKYLVINYLCIWVFSINWKYINHIFLTLQEVLKPLVEITINLSQLRERTGRQEPTVIT